MIATGTVSPATLPPSGGTAIGSLAIQSPTPLPSGTIAQAQVTETFGLTSGQTASEEQRTEDIILYRVPAAVAQGFSPAVSAFFPITPSQTYQTTALATGTVHLDILAGRESVRGQTGGSEPVSIDAGGGVTLTVPAQALPRDTAENRMLASRKTRSDVSEHPVARGESRRDQDRALRPRGAPPRTQRRWRHC